jgi:hypothetical protein
VYKIRLAAVTTILAFGLASPAFAVSLPFTGSLSIEIGSFPPFGSVPGSGTAQVNGSGAGGHLTSLALDAGVFQAEHLEIAFYVPTVFPIAGIGLTFDNGAGSFAGSGGAGFGGVMPLLGVMKICLHAMCGSAAANLSVPLSIGVSATRFGTGAVNLTVVGAPWTTGTAVVGTATRMGGVAPLSDTGAASGSVTLVTPVFISTNIGASSVIPSFGAMTLHFVPEPATLALIAAGIAGLAAYGRRQFAA